MLVHEGVQLRASPAIPKIPGCGGTGKIIRKVETTQSALAWIKNHGITRPELLPSEGRKQPSCEHVCSTKTLNILLTVGPPNETEPLNRNPDHLSVRGLGGILLRKAQGRGVSLPPNRIFSPHMDQVRGKLAHFLLHCEETQLYDQP